MSKKITKRDRFNQLLAIEEVKANSALVDFINHEIELIDKKNSSDKKPTATQIANTSIKETILDVMKSGERYTITDLQKANADLADLSNQKISALIRQLIADNLVKREEIKRKSYFSLVE